MSTFPLKESRKRTMSTAIFKSNLPDVIRSNRLNLSKGNRQTSKKQSTQNSTIILSRKKTLSRRMETEIISRSRIQPVQQHKPLLNGRYAYKALEEEMERVSQLFQNIKNLRYSHGVVSLDEVNSDENNCEFDEIPYHSELHQMNQQISHLKKQIENRMGKIFKISRLCPRIRSLIEHLLEKYSVEMLQSNQKYSKIAAMKAQTRLIASTTERYNRIIKY